MRTLLLSLALVSGCAHQVQPAPDFRVDPLIGIGAGLMVAGAGARVGLAYPPRDASWRDCVTAAVIADVTPRLGMAVLSRGLAPQIYEVDLQRCVDAYGVPPVWELEGAGVRRDLEDGITIALDAAGLVLTPHLDDCAAAVSSAVREALRDLAPDLLRALADPSASVVVAWPGLPSGICEAQR